MENLSGSLKDILDARSTSNADAIILAIELDQNRVLKLAIPSDRIGDILGALHHAAQQRETIHDHLHPSGPLVPLTALKIRGTTVFDTYLKDKIGVRVFLDRNSTLDLSFSIQQIEELKAHLENSLARANHSPEVPN